MDNNKNNHTSDNHRNHSSHSGNGEPHKEGHEEHVGHAYHEEQMDPENRERHHHAHGHEAQDHHGHSGYEGHGHEEHGGHHHHHGNFKELFFKSLPLGIIIMLMSPLMGLTSQGLITFPYSDIIVAILSTILLIYGGKPFYQGAVSEFKQSSPGMMALVSLGVSVSYLYSIYAVIARYVSL